MEKISIMGSGSPILDSKRGVRIPADKRLSKSETTKLNGREQLETIEFQERILEAEARRRVLLDDERKADESRDSCVLYFGVE